MPLRLPRSLYYTQNLSKLVEREALSVGRRAARRQLLPETREILEARANPDYARTVERLRAEMDAEANRAMQAVFNNRK